MDETQCLDDMTEYLPDMGLLAHQGEVLARLKARLNENTTAEFELREGEPAILRCPRTSASLSRRE